LLRFARNDVEGFEFQSAKHPTSRGAMPELRDNISPKTETERGPKPSAVQTGKTIDECHWRDVG